jgi:hypothetical protein
MAAEIHGTDVCLLQGEVGNGAQVSGRHMLTAAGGPQVMDVAVNIGVSGQAVQRVAASLTDIANFGDVRVSRCARCRPASAQHLKSSPCACDLSVRLKALLGFWLLPSRRVKTVCWRGAGVHA